MGKTKSKTNKKASNQLKQLLPGWLVIMMVCFFGLFAVFVSSTHNGPCCGEMNFLPALTFPLLFIFTVVALLLTALNFALLPRRKKTDKSTLLAYGVISLIYVVSIPLAIHIYEKPNANSLPENGPAPQVNLYSSGKVDFPVYTINNIPSGYTKKPLTIYELNNPDDTEVGLELSGPKGSIDMYELKNDAVGQAWFTCSQKDRPCLIIGSGSDNQSVYKMVDGTNTVLHYGINLPSTLISLDAPTEFTDQQAVELLNSLVPAQ